MAHEIRNVLIGSGISLVAAFGTAWVAGNNQLRAQREQFLMQQRATALRDFSSVIGNGEEVIHEYEALENEIQVAIEQHPSQAKLAHIVDSGRAAQRDCIHFISLLRSDETFITATFKIKFPTFVIHVDEVTEIGNGNSTVQDLKKFKTDCFELRKLIADEVNHLQVVAESLATQI
jgi:hypothetical protein